MAPEVLFGQPSDQKADIWSLGVILYSMLAAELPFSDGTEEELKHQLINQSLSFEKETPNRKFS